jgi:hypothetical protein
LWQKIFHHGHHPRVARKMIRTTPTGGGGDDDSFENQNLFF